MNTIYNYLSSVIQCGDYWLTYQNKDNEVCVYINCESKYSSGYTRIEQVRLPTNLVFNQYLNIFIDKLYYACKCTTKCKHNCNPPKFLGSYKIYDRNGIESTVTMQEYYSLSPLARFDHSYLCKLDELKQDYEVLFWVQWTGNKVKIIDATYANGLPVYDLDTAKRILLVCIDVPKLVFILPSMNFSESIQATIDMAKELPIKNKSLKINI